MEYCFRNFMSSRDKKQISKLDTLCISVICNNFQRYLSAWKFSDSFPPWYFTFLKKQYSSILFEKLQRQSVFSESLEFLINPYLQSITLELCCIKDIEPVAKGISSIAKNITNFKISGSIHNDHHLNLVKSISFCYFLNLQYLSLRYITKRELADIGKCCTILQFLDISQCAEIDDEGIQAFLPTNVYLDICQNFSLQYLDISYTSVTEASLPLILEHFPNLQTLHHEKLFSSLITFYKNKNGSTGEISLNLTELKSFRSSLSAHIIAFASLVCPNIKKLKLGHVTSPDALTACLSFPKLTDFSLEFYPYFSDSFLCFLQKFGKHLTRLSIVCKEFKTDCILSYCPNLRFFSINECRFNLPEDTALLHLFHILRSESIEVDDDS